MMNIKKQMLKGFIDSQMQTLKDRNIEFVLDDGEKSTCYRVKEGQITDNEIRVLIEEKDTGQPGHLTVKI